MFIFERFESFESWRQASLENWREHDRGGRWSQKYWDLDANVSFGMHEVILLVAAPFYFPSSLTQLSSGVIFTT